MVAIVSGNSLGLNLSSLATLGQSGSQGAAALGQSGERTHVNIATGNLLLQDVDDRLVGHGGAALSLRTYNSQAQFSTDNLDNWSNAFLRKRVDLSGTVNQAGSSLTRTDQDGASAVYVFDAANGRYRSTAGADAHDTILALGTSLSWIDGATDFKENYDLASGRMTDTVDSVGNAVRYAYVDSGAQAGLLHSVTDASGQTTTFDYSAARQLTQIRVSTMAAGAVATSTSSSTSTSTPTSTSTRTRFDYDALCRLSRVSVDLSPDDNSVADGNVYVTAYTYDGSSHRLTSVVQSDGTKLGFTYFWDGSDFRIASVTDGLGQRTSFDYDTVKRSTTVTDPLGLQTVYTYDVKGQLTRITAPAIGGGRQSISYTWNGSGDLARVIDGAGRVTDMQYDDDGNQVLQRDAAGNLLKRTWDSNHHLLTETVYASADPDAGGPAQATQPLTTRYVYDAGGRGLLRFLLSAEGRVTEYRYNAFGERSATIQYAGSGFNIAGLGVTSVPTETQMQAWRATTDLSQALRSDMAYDYRGQLQTLSTYSQLDADGNGVIDGSESIRRYVYDQSGQLRQSIDASRLSNGGMTSYVYDGLGRLLSTTDAQLGVTLNRYDDANHRIATTFANGLTTTAIYNANGAQTSVVSTGLDAVLLGTTRYAYDADGRLRMTTEASGQRSFLLYDALGRKVASVNAAGEFVEYRYNDANQIAQVIRYATAIDVGALVDANGAPANVALAAIRPAISGDDSATWNSYDAAGRLVKSVDGRGYVTQNEFDGAGRVVRVIRFATAVDISAFATVVPPAAITPPSHPDDRVTRSFYDADGNLTGQLDAEGALVESRYNAAGQLIETIAYAAMTEVAKRATGQLNELRPAASAGDIHQYRLTNAKGELTSTVDGEGILTKYAYDLNGNLARKTRYANPVNYLPSATAAQLSPAASAEDQSTTYAYTGLNQLKTETAADGTVTQYDYDATGNLVATTRALNTPEARTTRKRYDLQGHLIAELSAEGAGKLTGLTTQLSIDAVWAAYAIKYEVDADGRRIRATDQLGHSTLYFYDAAGRLATTVDATGAVEGRSYNAQGQLASLTSFGQRLAEADLAVLRGGALSPSVTQLLTQLASTGDSKKVYRYDKSGLLASEQWLSVDPVSVDRTILSEISTSHDAFGAVSAQSERIDASHVLRRQFSYDHRGLMLQSQADPLGINTTEASRYDAFGRVIETTGVNGLRTMTYDRNGRIIAVHDGALNADTLTTYDAFDRVLSRIDGLGNATRYRYETQQRRMTVTSAEGVTQITESNRFGQQLRLIDGNGAVTTFAYDLNGNLKSVSDALGIVSASDYDRAGNVATYTDAKGTQTTFTYDAVNRVLRKTVDPRGLNLYTSTTYDASGRVLSVTDPNGTLTQTTYDAKGQVTSIAVDPAGLNLVSCFRYDSRGKTLQVTDPNGTVMAYAYDTLGRRVQQTLDPTGLNLSTRFHYDAQGNVIASEDAAGQVQRFVFDDDHLLRWQIDAAGAVVRFDYDADARLQSTTRYAIAIDLHGLGFNVAATDIRARLTVDGTRDQVKANVYDKDGRLAFTVDGQGGITEQRFDANGNVVSRIRYANTVAPEQHAEASFADAQAAVQGIADAAQDQVTNYVFDARNRLLAQVDAQGAVSRQYYDANGNVVATVQYALAIDAGRLSVPATVSQLAALIVTNANDRSERRVFDTANHVRFVVNAEGFVTQFDSDALGRVVGSTHYAQPVSLDGVTLTAAAVTSALHADPVHDSTQRYAYDAQGNLTQSVDALGATERWHYDALGRKTSYTNKLGATWDYGYDAAGNLILERAPQITATRTAVDSHGILTASTANVRVETRMDYDALGNVIARTEAAGQPEERTTRFEYDAKGRQVRTIFPAVKVYDEARDDLLANGASGNAARIETAERNLTVTVAYDTFGNASANTDVAGNVSYKVYDRAGRVAFDIDAAGYVTGYVRDSFGRVTELKRYGAKIDVARFVNSAQTPAAMQALLAPLDHASDRSLLTRYDRLDRAIKISEPLAPSALSSTDASSKLQVNVVLQRKVTEQRFNAFGEMLEQDVHGEDAAGNRSGMAQGAHAYFDYDRRGIKTAQFDFSDATQGYLTSYATDAAGNVTGILEYATRITASNPTATGWHTVGAPVSANDRSTRNVYDRSNRKISETKQGAATGSVTTLYGYDALGNLTSTTDALNNVSFTRYDAMGRISGVAAPSDNSSAQTGVILTPITEFQRDSVGNVTRRIDYATSGTASASGITVAASAQDRITTTVYDRSGHAIQTIDAEGHSVYTSFDAQGHEAKQWQTVSDALGEQHTAFTVNRFDALGQLIDTIDPLASLSHRQASFNAFGEAIATSVDGQQTSYADYDAAGHLWRTNGGDGVDRVLLSDIEGRVTGTLTSTNLDLHAANLQNAAQVSALSGLIRTGMRYDLQGHVIEQTMPVQDAPTASATAVMDAYISVAQTAKTNASIGNDRPSPWSGANSLQLNWRDLSALGSGDIRLTIETKNGDITIGQSQTFDADVAAKGVTLDWDGAQIARILVAKKDVNGDFQIVLSRDLINAQASVKTNLIEVATPVDFSTKVSLRYRLIGTANWVNVTDAGFTDFGDARVFDASTLADGRYEYEIREQPAGAADTLRESGRWTNGVTELRVQVTQLFVLLFNRAPDNSSLADFVDQLQRGKSLGELAQTLLATPLGQQTFPASISSVDFIQRIVAGALNAAPDAATLAQWTAQLDAASPGQRGNVIADLMFAIAMYDGADPTRIAARNLFNNKASVAFLYAAQLGGADATVATAILKLVTASDTSAAVRAARDSVSVISGAYHRQIAQLTTLLFNRAPNAADMDRWVAKLQAGTSLAAVAQSLYDAGKLTAYPTGVSAADLISSIYRGALGREPDQTGLDYWSAQMNSSQPNAIGTTALAMIDAIVGYSVTGSDTLASQRLFRNKVAVALTYADGIGGIDDTAAKNLLAKVSATDTTVALASLFAGLTGKTQSQYKIAQLYVLLLNRSADADGLNYWLTQVNTGASMATIAQQMMAAVPATFSAGMSNDDFLKLLYANGCDRAAEADGLAYWTAQLASQTRGQVAANFAAALNTAPSARTTTSTGAMAMDAAGNEVFSVKSAASLTYAMQGGQDGDAGARNVVQAALADRTADLAALAAQTAQIAANIASANAATAAAQAANAAVASAAAALEAAAAAAALANAQMEVAGAAALAAQQAATAAHASAAAKQSAAQAADNLAAAAQLTAALANAAAKAADDVAARADSAESTLRANQAATAAAAAVTAYNKAVLDAQTAASAYANAVSTANAAQVTANNAQAAYNTARTNVATAQANLQTAQANYQARQTDAVVPNRIMAASALQRTQVMQLYVLLFNRSSPDLGGVDYWITQQKNGQSFAAIAQSMVVAGGLSGVSNQSVVESIYAGAFGRTVTDTGGIAYWTTQLDNAGANGKGAVFVTMINAVLGYTGSDPLGLATKASLSNKVNAGLASLQSQQTAAANAASSALSSQQSAQSSLNSANTSQSTANATLQSANTSLATANKNSTAAASQNTAAQSEVSKDLTQKNSTAASAASTSNEAAIEAAAATAAASAAAAVATLSATQAAQWRTQVVQLHLLLNNNARPTLAQVNNYVAQLATGTTLAQLAQSIYAAGPLATLTNASAIASIYRIAFGRTVTDTGGQNYWADQLNNVGLAGYSASKGQVFLNLISGTMSYAGSDAQGLLSRANFSDAVAAAQDALATQAASAAVTAQTSANAADSAAAQAQAAATAADQTAAAKIVGVHWASITVPASAAQLAVTRLYALLLNRAPDAAGLQYWTDSVNAGQTLPQIAQHMLNASENGTPLAALSSSTLVHNIYVNNLGRADSAGEAYWANLLDTAGTNAYPTKGHVLCALIDSVVNYAGTDAAALVSQVLFNNKVAAGLTYAVTLGGNNIAVATSLFGRVTADSTAAAIAAAVAAVPSANRRTIVAQLYVALRGANPDLSAFFDGVNRLDSGQAPATLAQSLIPAAMASMTNSQFVTQLYLNALGHSPDASGLSYWTGRLATESRGAVALAFIGVVTGYVGIEVGAVTDQKTYTNKVAAALANLKLLSASASSSLDAQRTAALAAATTAAQQSSSAASAAVAADAAARAAFDAIREVLAYSGPTISDARRQHLEMGAQVSFTQAQTPTVQQTSDRWGNVLSVTDVRNAAWVTRFGYDAGNHVIMTDLPDVDGTTAITRKTYDALGRLTSATDANGNLSSQRYDAQGNLVEERHADGGVVSHTYNALGERTSTTNTRSKTTTFDYDKLGRLTASHGPQVAVYGSMQSTHQQPVGASFEVVADKVAVTGGQLQQISQRYVYDEMGRRIAQVDANNAVTKTVYDMRGNVLANIDATDRGTTQRYDAQNRMISQTDGNGKTMSWQYDSATGRLCSHTDLGGHVTSYDYNEAGQLSAQHSSNGQDLRYSYGSAGQLTRVTDAATNTVATYAYDAAGKRVRETTTHNHQILQDNHLAYDEQGRLRLVSDSRYRAQYDYDAAGNRIHVQTSYLDNAGKRQLQDVWHSYDAMNRQLIVNGIKIGSVIVRDAASKESHELGYDSEGNRVSDTFYGQNYRQIDGQRQIIDGDVTETYAYDALNRLTDTRRGIRADDIMHIDMRQYDAAGHVVQSGWTGELLQSWAGDLAKIGVPTSLRTTYYDVAGRQLQQSVMDLAGPGADTYFEYDDAGNLDNYRDVDAGKTVRYRYESSAQFDHYQTSQLIATGAGHTAITTQTYDANGYLIDASEQRDGHDIAESRRLLENDIDGHVLRKTQNGSRLHALVVNGVELGTSGTGAADDSFNDYSALDSGYGNSPSAYIVRQGDKLQGIAKAVWGDASLWYLLADANALSAGSELSAGQTLTIPARSTAVHNTADSFNVYDATRMTGELTPVLPAPGQGGGCGAMGQIVMIAVAVAVTVYTVGAGSAGINAGFSQIMSAGVSGIAGGVGAGTMAMATAAGNIASQAVGMAIGSQDSFNWKQVGMAAVSGAVSGGLNAGGAADSIKTAVIRSAVGNALTQGVSVAVGFQSHFEWRIVAAAAVGTAVGGTVAGGLGTSTGQEVGGQLMRRTISSFAGGVAAAAAGGGRVNVAQVAVDAFGNALGNSFGSQQDAVPSMPFAEDRAVREATNYWNPEPASVSNSADPLAGIDMQSILNNPYRFAAITSSQNPPQSGEGLGKITTDTGLGTTQIFDALGNVTGVEVDATDDRPTLRYGEQMRKVAGFTATFGKNVVLGVAQGGIGFVSDVGKGWGMIGDMLVNGGRNIGQLEQFNLRPFQYDEGVGQFGGVLGEMASPAAYVKGAQLGVSGLRAMGPTFDSALYTYMQRTGGLLGAAPDVGGVNRLPLSFEDNLVVQGDASRAQIVQTIGDAVQPSLEKILILDPNARVGFRGSLVDGLKNDSKLGVNGERVAFDGTVATKKGSPYTGPQGYDADFFVVSDDLAAQFSKKSFFKDITRFDASLKSTFREFGNTLRSNPILSGMKIERPSFRVYSTAEIAKKSGAQYYFLQGEK